MCLRTFKICGRLEGIKDQDIGKGPKIQSVRNKINEQRQS
jgi:hypothetical protein